MKQNKNLAERFVDDKRYKAIEKIEHEAQMRIRGYSKENIWYFSPIFVSVFGWLFYAMYKNATLPYGQEYPIVSAWAGFWFFFGAGLSFVSWVFLKPQIKSAIDKQEKELTEDVYEKGAKFCSIQEFNAQMKDYVQNEQKITGSSRVTEAFCVPLDNNETMHIPRISLGTGLCIMGAPGQGKSVLINRLLDEIRQANSGNTKQIIIDVKGEFAQNFFDPKTDYILCPSDIRSVRFSLVNLLHTQIDTGVLAEILVADDKQTADPHWVAAARGIMEAVLVYASKRNLSNTDIYKLVSSPEELKEMVLADEEARLISGQYLYWDGEGNISKETRSILSTLARKAKTLQYLKMLDEQKTEKIYLDTWLKDGKPGRLFLLSTENLSKVFTPLYGVITSYLISTLLDMEDTKTNDFYFVLDELPRLGKALGENLEKGLAVGRSKGFKIVTAMQSYSQLQKEFGKDAAESILDTTNSFVAFKNNFGAQFLEKMFGKTTVIRNQESFSFAAESMGDRSQLSRQMVKEALVDDSEITRLEKLEFYAKIEGCKDVLKSKLAPKFVKSNGTQKYVENPAMHIKVLVDEMRTSIAKINNKFVSFENVKATSSHLPSDY